MASRLLCHLAQGIHIDVSRRHKSTNRELGDHPRIVRAQFPDCLDCGLALGQGWHILASHGNGLQDTLAN